ncbi:MAG: TonB-dependent receptor, partial [Candidatus Eremiobacteraeota bacterium]|nr:TonB-dependent receptor [Candidatus Eremiobacteraeota bacterium]
NANSFYTLTWPSSGGSIGTMPYNYLDHQTTQSSIEKISYTRALTSSSFLRLYGYEIYSLWNFDQATNGFLGDSYYDLHDHSTGLTLNYQNQLSPQHLFRTDIDYLQEKSLRYNYAPNFPYPSTSSTPAGNFAVCFPSLAVDYSQVANFDVGCINAQAGTPEAVAQIEGPYAYWNSISPITSDIAVADTWRPNDRLVFDLGLRYDRFQVPLMPLQITGPNGIAEIGQKQDGMCLHGYAYASTENCSIYLNTLATGTPNGCAALVVPNPLCPGMANWTDVNGVVDYEYLSPRFGVTFTADRNDVLRFAVGRYVQPPATAYEEYIAAPQWGANATIGVLNNFYDGLGFTAVHNIQPQDSTNYDFSWEHDFANSLSFKLSPYYRVTRNQILSLPVNAAQPTFVTGYNFGQAKIDGVEFALHSGHGGDGWSGELAATYTNSLIRFTAPIGGQNYINFVNTQISNYNDAYHTNYALFDPNGYYKPSLTISAGGTGASYDVTWVVNLNATYHTHGWDFTPTFNYQSGNPYGDPLLYPDSHCASTAQQAAGTATLFPGCTPNPFDHDTVAYGPDPYTNKFDQLGSLKGPSWLTMNFAVSHDIMRNVKATVLFTNIFTAVQNQGYPWEFPASDQVISYGDNTFYATNQFAAFNGTTTPPPPQSVYWGESYYGYAPNSIQPYHQIVFSVSSKI